MVTLDKVARTRERALERASSMRTQAQWLSKSWDALLVSTGGLGSRERRVCLEFSK